MTPVRIQPLAASTAMLAAEHARLSAEIERLHHMKEQGMISGQTLDEQMASHRAALAELEREQRAKEEAERQAAKAAAERAKRERLTGHARTLADAHASKLAALEAAEQAMAAMVASLNEAFANEAAERRAAVALATELNLDATPLQFSEKETKSRLIGNISAALARISAFCNRRWGEHYLVIDAGIRAGETWAAREARHTGSSVDLLLAHASGEKVAA
jgi:hypothetical protein